MDSFEFCSYIFHNNQAMQSTWRLVLQMQGLSFLGKHDFRFLHRNGCLETLKILSVSN